MYSVYFKGIGVGVRKKKNSIGYSSVYIICIFFCYVKWKVF